MNQQCKVCGEPAAGFHFGAFTCEGCKSFFGRTYNNLGSISECKNGGVCVINKKNRTACKACRLRKCLMVGMSKSGSRYGRRSNWFKIHCLLQEQSNGGSQGCAPGGGGGGVGGGGPFGGGFLPGFLPPSQSHAHHALANAYAAKEAKERGGGGGGGVGASTPSQEDLALQSHLLHVAIMKQERERGNKSPHPDDVALQNQLRLLAWQKERERASQQPPPGGTPPRDSSPPFGYKHAASASPIFPINFAQEKMTLASSPPEVFRPFLPTYKRTADTPSDSGASSSVEPGEHDESGGSNSALSYFKASAASPTLSERDFPRKINATVTLTTTTTTSYHPHQALVYPPPGLVTPAASQHSPRGGDLLLVSPSPGGLAIEQDEPIDLSVRTSRSSPRPSRIDRNDDSESPLDDDDEDDDDDDDDHDRASSLKHRQTIAKSKPLDLTLGLKRPAELSLTL